MISLNEFADSITLARETLESFMPSSFVSYTTVKEKSSHIELASSGGTIKKVKKRSVERTLYEFLALRAWHDLLETYSSLSPLSFRAPLPRGVYDLDKNETSLYMDFMQGYDVRKMGQNLRRTFPVRIKGQDIPIPLYPACALHLGALDCVREHEGVYHGDYDTRHIIFSPARDVSLAVIDVEGSRTESRSDIDTESQKMMDDFNRITSSQRDKDVLRTWYEQGRNMLSLSSTKYLPLILQRINQEYRVDFDMAAMSLNGFSLRDRGST